MTKKISKSTQAPSRVKKSRKTSAVTSSGNSRQALADEKGDGASKPHGVMLSEVLPRLAAQWHPSLNRGTAAQSEPLVSKKSRWWRCAKTPSHVWKMSVASRVKGLGCPHCKGSKHSTIERRIACELSHFFAFDIQNHQVDAGGETFDVDMIIYSLKLVIEYDGAYWHRDNEFRDLHKTRLLKKAGWQVIRVREQPLERLSASNVLVPPGASVKKCVDLVLRKIVALYEIESKDIAAYLKGSELAAEGLANEHLGAGAGAPTAGKRSQEHARAV